MISTPTNADICGRVLDTVHTVLSFIALNTVTILLTAAINVSTAGATCKEVQNATNALRQTN